MTFEIVFVLLSLLGMVAALVADKMRPGMILFSVVVLFLCAGILTPKEMLEGFSNKGMITVALLFLVSEGIRQSGTLGQVIKKLLPQGKTSVFKAQLRISGVTLYGPADEIKELSADSIVAQIDCQSLNLTVGQQTIAVSIQIPSSSRIFATGSYTVQCEVTSK